MKRYNFNQLLKSSAYLGQYGKIEKCVVNKASTFTPKNSVGPCHNAYITYSTQREAAIAILALDTFEIDDRLIRASFGTTKYCSFFLKGMQCKNKDCQYLHSSMKSNKIFTKEMMSSRAIYQEQEKIAFGLAQIEGQPYDEFMKELKKHSYPAKSVFPRPENIYHKKFFFMPNTLYEYQQEKLKCKVVPEIAHSIKNSKEGKLIKAEEHQINKFKFIKLLPTTDDLIQSSTELLTPASYILQEMNKELESQEAQEYLKKYTHTLDCFQETTKPAYHSKQHNYNALPLYTWAFQKLNNHMADSYYKVQSQAGMRAY